MAPLPPLPSNNTGVLYIDYTSGLRPHTLQIRGNYFAPVDATLKAQAVIDALRNVMWTGDTVIGARMREAGQFIALPVPCVVGPGTVGTLNNNAESRASFMSFVGRGLQGYPVRVTVFTLRLESEQQFRRSYAAMDAQNKALYDAVIGPVGGRPLAVDGTEAYWKNYANIGINAYYQRDSRT